MVAVAATTGVVEYANSVVLAGGRPILVVCPLIVYVVSNVLSILPSFHPSNEMNS